MTTRRSLALWVLVAASPGCDERCDLDQEVADLAGPDAVDCGSADGEHGKEAWACAIDAFEAKEAFRVSWTTQGVDSTSTYVLVSDGEKMWKLAQDDYEKNGDIDGWDCVSPYVTDGKVDPKANELLDYPSIACERLDPDGNHYQVCGTFSGGDPEPLAFDP
jgi:hypothetical protein